MPGFAGGGAIRPKYYTQPYRAIDYTGITRSYQMVQLFANSGLTGNVSTTAAPQQLQTTPELLAALEQIQMVNMQLLQTNQQLANELSNGIYAKLSTKQLDDVQAAKQQRIDGATFE